VRRAKYLVVLAAVAVAVGGASWVIVRALRAGDDAAFVYHVRAAYAGLPADDRALEAWLRAQPGVRNVAVGREANVLVVTYERAAADPPLGLLAECDRLGYTGRGSFTSTMDLVTR
jgi:hypothetical protein